MRVLLTGGSGDLGRLLARDLAARGDSPVIFDLRPPFESHAYIEGSINDLSALEKAMAGVDVVVHIAALHGIHESTHSASDFQKVNVDGTETVLAAMASSGVKNLVFISSTSIFNERGAYAHSKIAAEKLVAGAANDGDINALTLRPRAFIPFWNRQVYKDYSSWAKWFWGGAVHVDDVNQATLKAVDFVAGNRPPLPVVALTVDGAYDYTADELSTWDVKGLGHSFTQRYGEDLARLAQRYGLDISQKPKILDISGTRSLLGYVPKYSLKNLLDELAAFGDEGPPGPFDVPVPEKPARGFTPPRSDGKGRQSGP